MRSSLKLAKVCDIEIKAHISWVIIGLIVTLSLASYFFTIHREWPPLVQWSAALLTGLLFFSSVIAHELGHSLVAQHYGIKVKEITLFLFGGISQLEGESKSARQEVLIAIAGPIVSITLGLAFSAISLIAGLNSFIGIISEWLGSINIGLAIFNLLPGYPLDGGSVLRGIIWWKTGSSDRGKRVAIESGLIIAMLLCIIGVMLFYYGNGVDSLWITFVGWFLYNIARESERQTDNGNLLQGINAVHLMSKDFPTIASDAKIAQFVDEYLMRKGKRYALVVDENNNIIGLISVTDLSSIDKFRWPQVSVTELMKPLAKLFYLSPADSAQKAMELIAHEDINQLPIIESNKVIGVITREHFINFFSTREELVTSVTHPIFKYGLSDQKKIRFASLKRAAIGATSTQK